MVRVVATDPDRNRSISYTLEGDRLVTKLVGIDRTSGQIVVAGRVDRERLPWLNFTVRAEDSGLPPRSTTVPVTIQVSQKHPCGYNSPLIWRDLEKRGIGLFCQGTKKACRGKISWFNMSGFSL